MSNLVDLGRVSSETKSTRINLANQDSNKDLYACYVDFTVASGIPDAIRTNLVVSDDPLPPEVVAITNCAKQ
jgi:hypothetical protein